MFKKNDLVEVYYKSQALARWSDTMNVRDIEIIEYARHEEVGLLYIILLFITSLWSFGMMHFKS